MFEIEELNLYVEPVRIVDAIFSAIDFSIHHLKSSSLKTKIFAYFIKYLLEKCSIVDELLMSLHDSSKQIALGGCTLNKSTYALFYVYMKPLVYF